MCLDDELNAVLFQRFIEPGRVFDPVALSGVAGVAKRPIDELDIFLTFGQDSDRYALLLLQISFLGIGAAVRFSGFCKEQISLYNTVKLIPDAVSKP